MVMITKPVKHKVKSSSPTVQYCYTCVNIHQHSEFFYPSQKEAILAACNEKDDVTPFYVVKVIRRVRPYE